MCDVILQFIHVAGKQEHTKKQEEYGTFLANYRILHPIPVQFPEQISVLLLIS